MDDKRILIIAGCNGSGKTTFANEFLVRYANCPRFINADEIARKLSPSAPERVALKAGRLMLHRINQAVANDESFAIETTLSGVVYARKIKCWRSKGYRVILFFLKLDDVEQAIERVAERVKQGGHSIPKTYIRRRFTAGLTNFETVYRSLVDDWIVIDSSEDNPKIVDRSKNYEVQP